METLGLRKNEDYFFTITQDRGLIPELLKIKFYSKIKFKLFINENPNKDTDLHRGKFFPWPNEILEIPILNYDKIPKLNELFPDLLEDFEGRRLRLSLTIR